MTTNVPQKAPNGAAQGPVLRVLLVTLSILGTVFLTGTLRQLELGRTALERSRLALGLGDYRTAIEEAELAAASYVPRGRYHREGFERLMLIADDALGRADDETAQLAITSAKSASRTSPGIGGGTAGADWDAAIALRTSRLRTKTADLRAPVTRTAPIVVAEQPPPLLTYAWLSLAGCAYVFGVGFALRRGEKRPISLAGLALGVGALFFGLALYSL